jgi:PAS domain S-box-containing protein
MNLEPSQVAVSVVNHISAMVAYWDSNQRCVFSNDAYREWFGRSPEQMVGMSMRELLGPLYEKNLPYIRAALRGERQVFERQIPLPNGGVRESIATYTPDVADGTVRGFSVHVADVTLLRDREAALERAIRERDAALAEVRVLRGLLPICAQCKCIRDTDGDWQPIEKYVSERSEARFSHGICPGCLAKLYPEIDLSAP